MSSHRLDGDPFRFDFTDEFLAEFGFSTAGGVATTTGGPGDDDGDVEAPLFSFGSYSHEFDNASFTFSVESYVGDTRPRHKKRRPNRQYRKKNSVKQSCSLPLGDRRVISNLPGIVSHLYHGNSIIL